MRNMTDSDALKILSAGEQGHEIYSMEDLGNAMSCAFSALKQREKLLNRVQVLKGELVDAEKEAHYWHQQYELSENAVRNFIVENDELRKKAEALNANIKRLEAFESCMMEPEDIMGLVTGKLTAILDPRWISATEQLPALPEELDHASRGVLVIVHGPNKPICQYRIYQRSLVHGKRVEQWLFPYGAVSYENIISWAELPEV